MTLALGNSRWKILSLALGLLVVCTRADDQHALRGADNTSRALSGGYDVTIDFDDLHPGDEVSDQYGEYGLTLSVNPGRGGRGPYPVIFDTNNPITGEFGDEDLGSPNKECDYPGPGVGDGGVPGAEGENCEKLNNVLIIQEKRAGDIPDDNKYGGEIIFDFHPAAAVVKRMEFLDTESGRDKITVEHGVGLTTTFDIPNTGDNGRSFVDINLTHVTKITVYFKNSGAVTSLTFLPGADGGYPCDHGDSEPEIIEIPYNIITIIAGDTCFDAVAWCEDQLFDILMRKLDEYEELTPEQKEVLLNGLQAHYCDAAAQASAGAGAVAQGAGQFALRRGGCRGGVDQISLNVGLDTATIALADVDAEAEAEAEATAYAFAGARACVRDEMPPLKYRLCTLAQGEAAAVAIAEAGAVAAASAGAAASTSTDVSVFVDARRINEFAAFVIASASSFAATEASAAASAIAAAYAAALARVRLELEVKRYYRCRHKKRHCKKICRFGRCKCLYYWTCMGDTPWWSREFELIFDAIIIAIDAEVELSFAAAYAEALAAIDVTLSIPAYFKDVYGGPDVIFFYEGLEVEIGVATQCIA